MKLKLLRLAALALLKAEQCVSVISRRVGEYTLSVAADKFADEEDIAFNDAVAFECGCFGNNGTTMTEVYAIEDRNTTAYRILSEELDLEGV